MALFQGPSRRFYIWNFKRKKSVIAERVKKFVMKVIMKNFHLNVEEQDEVGKVEVVAEGVKNFVVEHILCLLDDYDDEEIYEVKKMARNVISNELRTFLVELLDKWKIQDEAEKIDVDVEKRIFVMDGSTAEDAFLEEFGEFLVELICDEIIFGASFRGEVGRVEVIAEEVKKFLVELHSSVQDNAQFPGDFTVDMHLGHTPSNYPCLGSDCTVASHGTVTYASMSIYALSGNVEDIFEVLLQMEIPTFKLRAVDEKLLPAVQDFLTRNPYLRKLYIDERYLKKDQYLVRNVVQSSMCLSTLTFHFNDTENRPPDQSLDEYLRRIQNKSLKKYLSHIHESKSLKTLDLSQVWKLTPAIIDGLVKGFAKSPKIKTLNMSIGVMWVDMEVAASVPVDISNLAKVLKNNDSLEEWNVGFRVVEGAESSILQCAELLKGNKSLKKLDLRTRGGVKRDECLIDPDTWIAFGKALSQTSSLKYLDISDHVLSKESWKAFGEGLKTNAGLLTLKAKKPRYYEENHTDILLPVFEALQENQTLESLELSHFDLSDSFASLKVLESVLTENRSLKSLVLRNSGMTDEGVAILSRSLPQMKGIEKLDLSRHGCTSRGAHALAEGMKNNYNILSIDFSGVNERPYSNFERPRVAAKGFEKEYREIEYYVRMNRKGRRCIGSTTPVDPSLWALILAKALKKEKPLPVFESEYDDESDIIISSSDSSTGDRDDDAISENIIDNAAEESGATEENESNVLESESAYDTNERNEHEKDKFAGDLDISIDAVFYLVRDILKVDFVSGK